MSDPTSKPNLFIVGAPKSGTTALYTYLNQHPDVYMSTNKEPCYLAPDFHSPYYPKNEEEYLELFSGARAEKILGEATTTYLYSKQAAARIKEFSAGARIIIMLRNPIDMIYSLHSQRLWALGEDIESFEEALEAENDRREGHRIPVGFEFPSAYLLYRDIGRYAEQVQRFLDIFNRERIHVIIYDDFKNDTVGEFEKVCLFLGIKKDEPIDFQIINPSKMLRSRWIKWFMKNHPPMVRALARVLLPFRFMRAVVFQMISWANTKYTRHPPLAPEMRQKLAAEFAHDVDKLSRLLDRDLSHWVSP